MEGIVVFQRKGQSTLGKIMGASSYRAIFFVFMLKYPP
jgi:hypothetical protein